MATVTKAKVLRRDLNFWDGVSKTATRLDSSGGTVTGVTIGDAVDVLEVYGSGAAYTLATLSAAVSAVGSNNVSFILATGTWEITGNLTIPSNVNLLIPKGAVLSLTSGKTLTVNGGIEAGIYQIFSGSGTASLSSAIIRGVYPEWWGAVGDGSTDDTTALTACFTSGRDIFLDAKTYECDGGNLTISTAGQKVYGQGAQRSIIRKKANGNLLTVTANYVSLFDCSFNGDDSATYTGYNIYISGDRDNFSMWRCNSFKCLSQCVNKEQGDQFGFYDCYFDNTDATAGTATVAIGASGLGDFAGLYGTITNCRIQPNKLQLDAIGGSHVIGSQVSGLDINTATGTATTNAIMGNRITGIVSIEGSNHTALGNQIGAYAITFESGSSGCMWIGNTRDASSSITNSGAASNIILEIDEDVGILRLADQMMLENNKAIRLYNAASSNYGSLYNSSSDNITLDNNAGSIVLAANSGQTVNLSVNSVTSVRGDDNATAGNTRLLIYDVDNATLERVSVGAADSGGAGFKVLRIPN